MQFLRATVLAHLAVQNRSRTYLMANARTVLAGWRMQELFSQAPKTQTFLAGLYAHGFPHLRLDLHPPFSRSRANYIANSPRTTAIRPRLSYAPAIYAHRSRMRVSAPTVLAARYSNRSSQHRARSQSTSIATDRASTVLAATCCANIRLWICSGFSAAGIFGATFPLFAQPVSPGAQRER